MIEPAWTGRKDWLLGRRAFWGQLGLAALVCACLGLYFFAFKPECRRIEQLADSLELKYQRLAQIGFQSSEGTGRFLQEAQERLDAMVQLYARLERQALFETDSADLTRASFRVLEFEQRRFLLSRDLYRLALSQNVELPDNIENILPAYVGDVPHPRRFWLRMDFFHHILRDLLQSGEGLSVIDIELAPERFYARPDSSTDLLELRLRLRVSGEPPFLIAFLNGALPEDTSGVVGGNAYFIERLDVVGAGEQESSRVTLDVRVSGFVATGREVE